MKPRKTMKFVFDHAAKPDPVMRAAWKNGPTAVRVCLDCGRPVSEHRDVES